MSITQRTIALIVCATLPPILLISAIGLMVMRSTVDQITQDSGEALLQSEQKVILQKARGMATAIDAFLQGYRDQVETLRQSLADRVSLPATVPPEELRARYARQPDGLLPGYGSIHPLLGAYANWQAAGTTWSPWIRRAVVDRIRNDGVFRQQAVRQLDLAMAAVPLMEALYPRHAEVLDLTWIVLKDGIAVTSPNDYTARLAVNPAFSELDEAEEDYVRLFDQLHNPARSTRWMSPYLDPIKLTWMVSCVSPLYDRDTFLGTVGADILLHTLNDRIRTIPVGQKGYALLLSAEGLPLAMTPLAIAQFLDEMPAAIQHMELFAPNFRGGSVTAEPLRPLTETCQPGLRSMVVTLLGRPEGVSVHATASGPMVFASTTINETNWKLITAIPLAEVNGPLALIASRGRQLFQEGFLWVLVAMVAVAGAAAGAGVLLAARTTRPIKRLITEINAIGSGGDWQPVSSGTEDAFRPLSESVNRMVAAIHQETSDRLRAEASYQEIFHGAADALLLHDAESFAILDANQAALELFQCPLHTLQSLTVGDISLNQPPYTQVEAVALMQGALTGEPQHFLWRIRDSHDRVFWVEISMKQAFISSANRILVSLRDVDARERALTQLRDSEAIFRNIVQASPMGMHLYQLEGDNRLVMIGANPAADRLLDIDNRQFFGRTIEEAFPPLVHTEIPNRYRRAAQYNESWHTEQIEYRDDIITGAFEVHAFQMSPGKTAVLFSDISRRKEMENALRESEERYRELVESANSIILRMDGQGRITFFNEFAQRFFGYEAADIIGRNAIGTIVPETDSSGNDLHRMIEEIVRHPESYASHENENMCRNGSRVWIAWTNRSLCDAQGRVTEILSVGNDVTTRRLAELEQEQLQAQLVQAQKMESVGRLAGGVAHDFNNMLSVILGQAELALDQMTPDQPLFKRLHSIRDAAQRSADLTRQLLAFARKQTVAPQLLDLNRTVEATLTMLRSLIGEDVDLVWHPGQTPGPVKMDPSQLDQILANLCVNAMDAISVTGRITIETGTAVFDEQHCAEHVDFLPGTFVLLAVSDNGCGMDAETLAHLFEPFFTTKEVGKGTGLGLATVYGIIKQNGGFINLYSEPNCGTTFKLYLPPHATKPAAEPASSSGGELPEGGQETILLVEDEPMILNMAKAMLQKLGYTVLPAQSPTEAIRLAREHGGTIHLLLSDVVMPEMNGRDLAQVLLADRPELNRLFMSGYTADIIAHHGVLDAGVHFVQKPFSLTTLAATVRAALLR